MALSTVSRFSAFFTAGRSIVSVAIDSATIDANV